MLVGVQKLLQSQAKSKEYGDPLVHLGNLIDG